MTTKYFHNEAEVLAVPQPEFTNTWHPVAHRRVIETVNGVLEEAGIGVKDKRYSLSADGANCFSSWVLDSGFGGRDPMLGFRNSINKSFALGFCAGAHIIVCSNMMFGGEFVEFNKHTAQMDDQMLHLMATNSFEQIQQQLIDFSKWHDHLAEFLFRSRRNFKALVFDALNAGVISPPKFNQFLLAYEEEMKVDSTRSLKTFHGSATRMMRENSLFSQSTNNRQLNSFCDDYMASITV